jgi:UDP-2,4-diacetamido-2,4,6-trideoxy-beta-L-altropyranose hydrolase
MDEGKRVHFISAEINNWLSEWLRMSGFELSRLPVECVGNPELDARFSSLIVDSLDDCVWVVVDHYGLDSNWETVIKENDKKVLAVDDACFRDHNCDVLLDTSLRNLDGIGYLGRQLSDPVIFSGPNYILLRPEFEVSSEMRLRTGEISKILIFFGGGEIDIEIRRVIGAISQITLRNLEITLVFGRTQPNERLVRDVLQTYPSINLIDITFNMAHLINEADLAIGTCGVSAWERCALGLPALTVVTSDNQRDDARYLDNLGVLKNLGESSQVTEETWLEEITNLLNRPAQVSKMSKACRDLNIARKDSQKALVEIFTR